MWHCVKCGEEVEDIFEIWWNCQAGRSGRSLAPFDLDAPATTTERTAEITNRRFKLMDCLRGNARIDHVGTREFHEGANYGLLGDLEGLFVGREQLDMYHCPECGHVEFFAFGE